MRVVSALALSDGWETEGSKSVLLLSDNVSAVSLHTLAEVGIWLNLFLGWLSVDASGGVPRISGDDIFDAVDKVSSSIVLTLSEIFGFT